MDTEAKNRIEEPKNLEEVTAYIIGMAALICDKPADLFCTTSEDERGILITLFADRADLGRLIGKKGATAQAMRTLLRVLGGRQDAKYSLKFASYDDEATDTD